MAQQPFYNQEMLDDFKREIRFERIVSGLPPDKLVLVDWVQAIKEFKDTEGTLWRGRISSVFGMNDFGRMDGSLKSSQGQININITLMRDGQRAAIEHALQEVATTSMDHINSRVYEPCFADFCLTLKHSRTISRLRFVYGNMYIWLDDVDESDKDVLPVARYLQSLMEKAVAANPEGKLPPRPHISYTVNPKRVKVGENFTVTAKFDGGAQLDPKAFRVAKDLISSNIEYQENLGGGVYKFTAKAAGMGTVAFGLFDKKTLWVFNDNVTVHIDPTQSK